MSNIETIHEERAGQLDGHWQTIGRLWVNWNRRRHVRKFRDFDERILDDIGVTREEVAWASRLPITVNAAQALQDKAWRRRQSELRGKQVRWSRRKGVRSSVV